MEKVTVLNSQTLLIKRNIAQSRTDEFRTKKKAESCLLLDVRGVFFVANLWGIVPLGTTRVAGRTEVTHLPGGLTNLCKSARNTPTLLMAANTGFFLKLCRVSF